MGKIIDITGQKFGRWTVMKLFGIKRGSAIWLCKCDCGNEKTVSGAELRRGKSKSCGCYSRDRITQRSTKHGLRHTRIYNIWRSMKDRCYNKNSDNYYLYGGRGISISPEWRDSPRSFYDWAMSNGYQDAFSLDRIDCNRGYFPENCRWATAKEQARNRRSNHLLKYNGQTKCLIEWAEEYNLSFRTLDERIRNNWDIGEALTTKNQRLKQPLLI